jgi:hypothetical protein
MRTQWFLTVVVVLLHGACSSDNAPATPVDASSLCGQGGEVVSSPTCTPRLPYCWTPTWRPPRSPMANACSDGQVAELQMKCWGSGSNSDCAAFHGDPANGTCLQCLFSTAD